MMRFTLLPLAVLLGLTGCLTADGTLDASGKATLTISYPIAGMVTEEQSKALLVAPDVTLEAFEIEEKDKDARQVKATVKTDAVDKLAALPLLQTFKTAIEHTAKEDGSGRLAVQVSTGKPGRPVGDSPVHPDPVRIRITLPGEVTETSEKAEGKTVEWTFLQRDWIEKGKLEMTAEYAAPADAAKPATE